jgi:hypothetical protein
MHRQIRERVAINAQEFKRAGPPSDLQSVVRKNKVRKIRMRRIEIAELSPYLHELFGLRVRQRIDQH